MAWEFNHTQQVQNIYPALSNLPKEGPLVLLSRKKACCFAILAPKPLAKLLSRVPQGSPAATTQNKSLKSLAPPMSSHHLLALLLLHLRNLHHCIGRMVTTFRV